MVQIYILGVEFGNLVEQTVLFKQPKYSEFYIDRTTIYLLKILIEYQHGELQINAHSTDAIAKSN